jgi:hypothetical protein
MSVNEIYQFVFLWQKNSSLDGYFEIKNEKKNNNYYAVYRMLRNILQAGTTPMTNNIKMHYIPNKSSSKTD